MIFSEITRPNGEFRKKMLGIAIVCEYNPFQKGHKAQIDAVRAAHPDACIVCVLAGDLVQRGEPAVLSKYLRAEVAVRCGADLVLELPFPWSAQGAAYYARAAVSIAADAGCGALCFGSESGDVGALSLAADRLCSDEFAAYLRETDDPRSPVSHIVAVNAAYSRLYGEPLPGGANDILGIEYIRAIKEPDAKIEPFCVRRTEGYSATEAREASDYGEFIRIAATKKYTDSRLRRAALAALLGVTEADAAERPAYTSLLAASKRGTEYLGALKKRVKADGSGISVLTRPSDGAELTGVAARQFALSVRAGELWALAAGESPADQMRKSPYIRS